MHEIAPGLLHWTAPHDGIGLDVSSYLVEPAGIVIDPMVPEEGLDAVAARVRPQQVVLTSGLHTRHAERLAEAFGCPIVVSCAGADRIGDALEVETYGDGDEVAPGVHAVEVGVICPDEFALHLEHGGGALAIADALHGYGDTLAFFSDDLLGDDAEGVKAGLRGRLRELLQRDFEHVLPAHGAPLVGTGRQALREFVT